MQILCGMVSKSWLFGFTPSTLGFNLRLGAVNHKLLQRLPYCSPPRSPLRSPQQLHERMQTRKVSESIQSCWLAIASGDVAAGHTDGSCQLCNAETVPCAGHPSRSFPRASRPQVSSLHAKAQLTKARALRTNHWEVGQHDLPCHTDKHHPSSTFCNHGKLDGKNSASCTDHSLPGDADRQAEVAYLQAKAADNLLPMERLLPQARLRCPCYTAPLGHPDEHRRHRTDSR